MAQLTVTATPQQIPDGWDVAQNLGAADVWFGSTAGDASAAKGNKLPVNGTLDRFVMDQTPTVWVATAASTADLRYYLNTEF